MTYRWVKVPVLNKYLCVHTFRRSCEHFGVAGAIGDFICFYTHSEMFMLILACKAGLILGCSGVYFLGIEEKLTQVQ